MSKRAWALWISFLLGATAFFAISEGAVLAIFYGTASIIAVALIARRDRRLKHPPGPGETR